MRALTLLSLMLLLVNCSTVPTVGNGPVAIGRVDGITGQPSVIRGGSLINIGPRTSLQTGDTLLTNQRGTATISMSDGTALELRENVQITFQQFAKTRVTILSSAGSFTVDPGRNARQQGADFSISTPFATIIPYRGRLFVSHGAEQLEVILLEDGQLTVRNDLGQQVLTLENEMSVINFIDPPSKQLSRAI